ncbi:MAG: response regulator [Bacteroidetes bacterium]|nr:MAG: response regulator [Bacteroidota bacterium]REK00620.1 MAG: response regulator [Bacteroidota bacterium]REK35258.1 MAG: response regulator [Bacteroidota bacterium]REK48381.1 MAG: response regulator [Bacteroidota bacterium]
MSNSSRYPVVMLVDDNELDNFINKKLIENENFASEVIVQISAQSALDELKKRASGSTALPNIIFLDIMMPHMDGFGFLEEFGKLDEKIRNSCRVIMLSTSESFKDLNKANQNKYVSKFLNKPLNKAVLEAINV